MNKPVNSTTDGLGLEPRHYVGARSELIAAALYISKGFQVYWPQVQQSVVDFVVEKEGLVKVQVKTGTWNGDHLQCRVASTNKYNTTSMYDVLLVVSDIGCWEIPAELINTTNLCLANRSGNYKPRGTDWGEFKVQCTL